MPPAAIAEKPKLKVTPAKSMKKPAHAPTTDDHLRLKASKVNAVRMDAAVAELKAGKGVKWDPFKP